MGSNTHKLRSELDQSIWYDNISRTLLQSGEFQTLIDAGVRGCTSNPTIFERSIRNSSGYDDALRRLVSESRSIEEIYYDLIAADVRDAADLLRPIYDASGGVDGYVSIEVLPEHADDTDSMVGEGKRLHQAIHRDNVMIKIPATPSGCRAIRQLIGTGICVNATLIFGIDQYLAVTEAYIAGLQIASQGGHELREIASVASFFISRLDSEVDPRLRA